MKSLRQSLNSELRLVALLSSPDMTAAEISEATQLFQDKIDDNLFIAVVDQHRVWPSVHLNAKCYFSDCISEKTQKHLNKKYHQNTLLRLRQFQAQSNLLVAFKKEKIPLALFKGSSSAKKLYGDIAKRHSIDIDLVTQPGYLFDANTVLNKHGFKCDIFEEFTPKQLNIHLKTTKDLAYINNEGIMVELHFRLFNHSSKLSTKYINELLTQDLSQTKSNYEFIYLCRHGSQHLYHRLKWLLDITLYVNKYFNGNKKLQEENWNLARSLGMRKYVAASWVLASVFYKIDVPLEIMVFYDKDKATKTLVKKSISKIRNSKESRTFLFSLSFKILTIFLSQNLQERLSMLFHMLFSPRAIDIKKMPYIPDKLLFIHYLSRPFFVLQRALSRVHFK